MIDPTKVTRIVLQRLLTETLLKFIFLAISIVCDFFKFRSMYLSAHLYGFFFLSTCECIYILRNFLQTLPELMAFVHLLVVKSCS